MTTLDPKPPGSSGKVRNSFKYYNIFKIKFKVLKFIFIEKYGNNLICSNIQINCLFLFFQQNTFFLQYTLFCSHLFHKTLNNQILFTNKFIIHQFTKKKIFFLFKIRIISKNFTNCNLYFFQAIHIFINICNFKFR